MKTLTEARKDLDAAIRVVLADPGRTDNEIAAVAWALADYIDATIVEKYMVPPPHPEQPIVMEEGVRRFKKNAIIRFLLDTSPHDMNDLAKMVFSTEDRCQFLQLIGYSVEGYCEFDMTEGRRPDE